MARYILRVSYDGSAFCGWQWQKNAPSVQESIENAFKSFSGENVRVHAAGRTDSGVHAVWQTLHGDMEKPTNPEQLKNALNFYLPRAELVVRSVERANSNTFHARFSALGRRYLYRLLISPTEDPLRHRRVLHVPYPLDRRAMQEAAAYLFGKHDFSSFRSKHCQASSPMRTMTDIQIQPYEDELRIGFLARSFLHHQVRIIMGALLHVGHRRSPPSWMGELLAARDRSLAPATCPAHGLYFLEAFYHQFPQSLIEIPQWFSTASPPYRGHGVKDGIP